MDFELCVFLSDINVNVNTDLINEVFTVGRSNKCDYDLDNGGKGGLKEKHMVQTSKNHFKITRDLSSEDNPVYIEVLHSTLFN